jgi:O-antigen/teichoic acid export membrane protein
MDTPRVAPAAGEPAGALLRTLTYFVSGALGGLCSVALTLLLLRLLGGEGYKSVGLALSASMFVIAVTFEWLRFYALRFGAEPWRLGPIYSLYALSAAALLSATGIMMLLGVRGQNETFALIVAAIAIAQAVCDLLIVVARSASNALMLVIMQAGRGAVALAACGATAAITGDPQATLITYVAAYAGVSVLTAAAFRRSMPPGTLFSVSDALRILHFGGPLMVSALVNSLLLMSDRWIITLAGRFTDAAIGGYIGLSDICIRALVFFAGVLVSAFLQDILAAFDRGEQDKAGGHYSLMTAIFAVVMAPIAIGAVIFSAEAASLFARTAQLPPLLFTSIVIAVIAHVSRNALIETLLLLEKRTVLVLAINVGALAFALGLSFILTPIWGMAGVPIAFSIASVTAGAVGLAVMRPQTRALLALDATARVIVAAIAAGLVCVYVVPHSIPAWTRLAAFAGLYAAFLAPLLVQRLRAKSHEVVSMAARP